jgi:hypothetical protein
VIELWNVNQQNVHFLNVLIQFMSSLAVVAVYSDGYIVSELVVVACMFHCTVLLH